MFKENKEIQQSLFNKVEMLPGYLKDKLKKSWAQVFRDHVFLNINENRFSILYSEKASRPNSTINVLIGLLVIKDMNGLTDEELVGSIHFDTRYQYALCTENLERQPISDNSFTNFRNRLYEYEKETGIDLLHEEVEALSQVFTDALEIDGKNVRMDSLMISSNCKKMSRLELIYTVIYKHIKELAKVDEALILEAYKVYLKEKHRKEFIYQIKNDALDSKLAILLTQAYELYQNGLGNQTVKELESFKLLERLINEQVTINEEGSIEVKEGKEIKPVYLQSATDPDATYRKKYKDNIGYVANVVETYDDSDEDCTKGIITSYDYKPNTHSDIEFARDYINETIKNKENNNEDNQTVKVSLDGAYFEQDLVNDAKEHNIDMYFTNLVGRKPNPDKLSCTAFEIDEEDKKIAKCPNGVIPTKSRLKDGVFLAHFNKNACEPCPYIDECPIRKLKKSNVVSFTEKSYQTEQLRKAMSTSEYKEKSSKRAAIEGVPSTLRRGYNVDHMPFMGFVRSKMAFGFKILAMNVKSLQKGLKHMDQSLNKDGNLSRITGNLSKLFKMKLFSMFRPQMTA
jgi:hypothetical protein